MTKAQGNSKRASWEDNLSCMSPDLDRWKSSTLSVTVLSGIHGEERSLSFRDLAVEAKRFAEHLRRAGVRPGEKVPLLLPTSMEAVVAILAVWHLGAAFSILPVASVDETAIGTPRIRAILALLRPRCIVTLLATETIANRFWYPVLPITLGDCSSEAGSAPEISDFHFSGLAFVQFSSGSTSDAIKGVLVKHNQLSANIDAIGHKIGINSKDKIVLWTPLYHDLGLVSLLIALHFGIDVVLIPTETFMRKPSVWLSSISRYRGTVSPGPPFAFNLLTKRAAAAPPDLDLSCWKYAGVGAEPVFADGLREFERAYASKGLRKNVLQAVYGLAESVLVATSGASLQPRLSVHVDGHKLRALGRAILVDPDSHEGAIELQGCGGPAKGVEVAIWDDLGNALPPCQVGRIHLRGPSITAGYLGAELTRGQERWLDTGDLGFEWMNQLFVVARTKDVIKRGGCLLRLKILS